MGKMCPYCKTILTRKKTTNYKSIFTCRRPDCPNYNKDVLVKKLGS